MPLLSRVILSATGSRTITPCQTPDPAGTSARKKQKYLMQQHGIIHQNDGTYVHATVQLNKSGSWSFKKVKRWDGSSTLHQVLLLNQGIFLGIPCWWKPHTSSIPIQNVIIGIHETTGQDFLSSNAAFDAVANATEFGEHHGKLHNNLLGVVSEEAFLVTVPGAFRKNCQDDFVAIYNNGSFYTIGIVIAKTLLVSFRVSPPTKEALENHMGRIERYWQFRMPAKPFPDVFIALGARELFPGTVCGRTLSFMEGLDTRDEPSLKAIGVALVNTGWEAPHFADQTVEAGFRNIRSMLAVFSAGVLALGVLICACCLGLELLFNTQRTAYEKEYQNVILNNQEIKQLLEGSNKLAQSIRTMEETFSRKTVWSKFLYTVANARPDDLYFDRIGSEPIAGNPEVIHMAISGWTMRESSVTTFIARLQDLKFLSKITLMSMERQSSKQSVYGFKVVCILQLKYSVKKK